MQEKNRSIRALFNSEVASLLDTYRQFQTLLPSDKRKGASQVAEEGRHIEELVKASIRKFCPKNLEVFSGFILRPSTKTGKNGWERKNESVRHSSQLDIIVFNSADYPVFLRFGDSAVVPPEGVIAIISIKKTLSGNQLKSTKGKDEIRALLEAAQLCHCLSMPKDGRSRGALRKPFIGLLAMTSNVKGPEKAFERIKENYESLGLTDFEDLIGLVCVLDSWSIFKCRPTQSRNARAKYIGLDKTVLKKESSDYSLAYYGLQWLISGILSVYYDESRHRIRRPGFNEFELVHPVVLGEIPLR